MDDVYQQTVTDIRNGVRFAGWLLVKEATVRQTASGKSFLDMRLVDCTGVVPGKFWDYTGDAPAVGTVVYVEGLGNLYNGHLQLRIDSFRAAVPEDGKQASDFIPSAPETPESMLEEILSCARALRDDSLRGITLQLLTWANADGRLLTAPAAKSMHHAELGGLLHHTVTILRAARALMSVYPGLDKDLLYAGVIAHDLGKLDEMQTNGLGLVDAYTVDGHLIGHLVRGVVNIERAASEVGADRERATLLQHLILSHHEKPEFGSPVFPAIPEAVLLSTLDRLDARLFEMQAARQGVAPGEFSQPVWALDNVHVYQPAGPRAPEPSSATPLPPSSAS